MTEFDYALVENTLAKEGENPIVACICLHACSGYYGKVRLVYGKPECVGTLPEYRNRGLIRRLFHEMIHPASDSRGDLIQILPGIPHFYLQFGYEYACRDRTPLIIETPLTVLPDLDPTSKKGQNGDLVPDETLFALRAPTLDDIPYLVKMSTPERLLNQAKIGLIYDEAYWKYTAFECWRTQSCKYDTPRTTRIIVDPKTGRDCGIATINVRKIPVLHIFTLEEGYQYRDALYPVLRQLIHIISQPTPWELKQQQQQQKEKQADEKQEQNKQDNKKEAAVENVEAKEDNKPNSPAPAQSEKKIQTLGIALDYQHPIAQLLESKSKLSSFELRFYTRIFSYAKFILKVAPELEDRLAKSCLAGITVTWQFDFFRKVVGSAGRGLEIVFKEGKIVSATDDYVPLSNDAKMLAARKRIALAKAEGRPDKKPLIFSAEFAPLSFTKLLVGEKSLEQMLEHYAEASVSDPDEGTGHEAKMMLNILFPKQQFHMDTFWW
ncbi:hypothetical protein BX616_007195 [Lobosporangium transversale]|nr:hypothetical protein BX616_007195 [Lobosporangium transversale]